MQVDALGHTRFAPTMSGRGGPESTKAPSRALRSRAGRPFEVDPSTRHDAGDGQAAVSSSNNPLGVVRRVHVPEGTSALAMRAALFTELWPAARQPADGRHATALTAPTIGGNTANDHLPPPPEVETTARIVAEPLPAAGGAATRSSEATQPQDAVQASWRGGRAEGGVASTDHVRPPSVEPAASAPPVLLEPTTWQARRLEQATPPRAAAATTTGCLRHESPPSVVVSESGCARP